MKLSDALKAACAIRDITYNVPGEAAEVLKKAINGEFDVVAKPVVAEKTKA